MIAVKKHSIILSPTENEFENEGVLNHDTYQDCNTLHFLCREIQKGNHATIGNIKDGKGAINYLSNDPKLVAKIDSTMTTINQASFRLNENLEAMIHNFLFRGYFRKLEKAKEQKK